MPKPNEIVIIQSLKAFSAFDYVVYMQKRFGTIDELVLSSYNMSHRVVSALVLLINEGSIKKADVVVNEKYKEAAIDRVKFEELTSLAARNANVKLHFDPNHTKNILIRIGYKYYVWFGSGNSSSNAQKEDYIWMMDEDTFNFKKNYLLNENNEA
jgi:hypothetical protein